MERAFHPCLVKNFESLKFLYSQSANRAWGVCIHSTALNCALLYNILSVCAKGTPLYGNKIVTREKMAVSRDKNSLKLFSSSMYKMRTTARSFTHEAWLMLQNYLNYQPFSSDKMKLQFLITKTYYITYIGRNAVMEGSTFFV